MSGPPVGWLKLEKLPPSKTPLKEDTGNSVAAEIIELPGVFQSMSKVHNLK